MAFLTITTGERTGERIEIDKNEITIGRSDQNDIALDDAAVSGRHCAIIKDGNKISLRDNRSTNGTRLNGKNVTSEVRLKPDDVVSVGSVEIQVSGTDIEVEPEMTKSAPAQTVIIAPPRTVSGGNPPSPVFQTKRDNKLVVIAIILLCVIVVAAAGAWFLINLLK